MRYNKSELPVIKEIDEWWELPAGCYGCWTIVIPLEGEIEVIEERKWGLYGSYGYRKLRAKTEEAVVVKRYHSYDCVEIVGIYRLVRDC